MGDADDDRLPLFPITPNVLDAVVSENTGTQSVDLRTEERNNPATLWTNERSPTRDDMGSYNYVMENGIFDAEHVLGPTSNTNPIPEFFLVSPPKMEQGVKGDGMMETARKDRMSPSTPSPTLVELLDQVLASDAARVELLGHSSKRTDDGPSHPFYHQVAHLAGFGAGSAANINEHKSVPSQAGSEIRRENTAVSGNAVVAPGAAVLPGDASEEQLLPDPRPGDGGDDGVPQYDPAQALVPDVDSLLLQVITNEILEDFHSGVDYLRSVRSGKMKQVDAPSVAAGEDTFPCGICMCDVAAKSEAKVSACADRFCRDCIISYLNITILSKRAFPIRCPDMNCGQYFDAWKCADFLDKCRMRGADQLRLLAVHRSIVNLKYCANPRCNAPFDFIPAEQPACTEVTCPLCKLATCVVCGTEYHPGRSCEQVSGNEPLNKLKNEQKWKHCPSCNQLIERVEGCEHMVCHCGAEFCYLCGQRTDEEECKCIIEADYEE